LPSGKSLCVLFRRVDDLKSRASRGCHAKALSFNDLRLLKTRSAPSHAASFAICEAGCDAGLTQRDDPEHARREQDEAELLGAAQPLAKNPARDQVAEIKLDETERTYPCDGLHRHRGKPARRAERAHP